MNVSPYDVLAARRSYARHLLRECLSVCPPSVGHFHESRLNASEYRNLLCQFPEIRCRNRDLEIRPNKCVNDWHPPVDSRKLDE